MHDDEPKTDPRPPLPARRHHTGSQQELESVLGNVLDEKLKDIREQLEDHMAAETRARARTAEELMKQNAAIITLGADLRQTNNRLLVVEATKIIMPVAMAAAALVLSSLCLVLMFAMHAR